MINLKIEETEKSNKVEEEKEIEILSKRNLIITIIVIIIIIVIVQIVEYNNDLKECYTAIKVNSDWKEFESIIEKHPILSESFEDSAYKELYKAMDEEIENIKNNNYDKTKEIFTWTGEIRGNSEHRKKIEEKKQIALVYHIINEIDEEYKQKEEYSNAYIELDRIKEKYVLNNTSKEIIKEQKEKIEENAVNQIIQIAQENINSGISYSDTKEMLECFSEIENETIINLYNICNEKVKEEQRIQKEKQEEWERERIAKEKLDFEIYCYFNLIAWKEKNTITDDIAFSKCATKFGITKEQAKESYDKIERTSYSYQTKYPDIYEKYANQY